MKRRSDEEISAPLYEYDAAIRAQYGFFAGVDEAGRGPLCGPVVVAACILDPEKPVYRIVWIFQPYLAQAEMPAAWRDFPAVGYEQLQNPAFQPGCGCFPVPSGDPGRLVITTARLLKGETVPAIEDRRTTEQRLTAILAHISAAHGFERPLPHGREQLRLEAAILKRRARNLFFQIARRLLPSESLRWQCANRIRTIFKPRV